MNREGVGGMSLDKEGAIRVIKAVDAGFQRQLVLTEGLIRFQSTRGAELGVQDFVFQELRDGGDAMERFNIDKDAVARHPDDGRFSEDMLKPLSPWHSSSAAGGRTVAHPSGAR